MIRVEGLRFAAFSDIHGHHRSLSEMLDLAKAENVDFLVFGGDMTDAEYSGYADGVRQMKAICSTLKSSGLDILYILGNRDRVGDGTIECDLDGDLSRGDVEVDGIQFTTKAEGLDKRSIYVCHNLEPRYRRVKLQARLVLYGHDHVPRIYGNYVGLGYIRDPIPEKPDGPRGGFFIIDLDAKATNVHFLSLGGTVQSRCRIHADQGTFFVPVEWQGACPMCRNDAKHRYYFV